MPPGVGSEAAAIDFPALADQAARVAQDAVAATLASQQYVQAQVPMWQEAISERVLSRLVELSENFKYVVSCIVLQRSGGGFESHASAYWNPQTDGSVTVLWENEVLACTVTVFGVAIS